MRARFAGLLVFALVAPAWGEEPLDATMGNWEGTWSHKDGQLGGEVAAKIAALGKDEYEGVFTATCQGVHIYRIPMKGKREGKAVAFIGTANLGEKDGTLEWTGKADGAEFKGTYKAADKEGGTFELKRVYKTSPTLGAKPPEGAVVLFDGKNLANWVLRDGGTANWDLADGAMTVPKRGPGKGGDIISREKFLDHKLHVEFRTPFMPDARGQGRGNSGVYAQGRYEVQVLDSFGQPPRDNEAGGIYQIAVPKENASLPPGEWQTYDITFTAPRFNDKGEMVKPPTINVVYNGVVIHENVTIPRITRGGIDEGMKGPGGLLLQDHGNPVQYRNIWAVPLGASATGAGS